MCSDSLCGVAAHFDDLAEVQGVFPSHNESARRSAPSGYSYPGGPLGITKDQSLPRLTLPDSGFDPGSLPEVSQNVSRARRCDRSPETSTCRAVSAIARKARHPRSEEHTSE